jgi:hypothetical protein
LYLSFSRKALELFDCQTINGVAYFEAEPGRKCYQEWWNQLLPVVFAAIAFYVVGIPLLLFILFRSRVHIIQKVAPSQRTAWQRFLLRITYKKRSEFKLEYEYWDTVLSLRKLLIVMSQLFFSKYAAFQAGLLIMVLVMSLVLHTAKQPYAIPSLNILESATLLSSILVLVAGIMFYVNEFKEPSETAALGFAVVVVIAACVLYVAFALLAHLRFLYIDYHMKKKHSKPKK